jgi:hypothetical protein
MNEKEVVRAIQHSCHAGALPMIDRQTYIHSAIARSFILCALLLMSISGCAGNISKKGGASLASSDEKTEINTSLPGIIRVVNYSGKVSFHDAPVDKDSKINGAGKLKAIGESAWVDIEYLGGEKIRLTNGIMDIRFGKQSEATAGLPIEDRPRLNANVRKIRLEQGKLYAHLKKHEQLRKVKYYFSTDIIFIDVQYGSFAIIAQPDATQIAVCNGQVSIGPSYTIAPDRRPKWPEMNVSNWSKVLVNLTDAPQIEEMQEAEKTELSNIIAKMKDSGDGP